MFLMASTSKHKLKNLDKVIIIFVLFIVNDAWNRRFTIQSDYKWRTTNVCEVISEGNQNQKS